MRFSTLAALCATPLALASSLEAGLVARGALDTRKSTSTGEKDISVEVASSSSTSLTEIIIIWVNNGGGAPTQTINSATTVSQATAAAATHTVVVGGTAGLVYTPDTIAAAVGDMVIFEFQSNNHTATQSAFTTPCEKLAGGVDSGFMPNINNTVNPAPQMAMQVTVATPIWFYCRQSGHCGKGMTFSINPTMNKTQADFQQMAIQQNGTGSTAVIAGGAAKSSATTVSVAAATSTASTGTIVAGSGTVVGDSCSCSCLCGVAAFPNAAVQGIGAFGGLPGRSIY
jgi:plastocyanin